MWERIARHAGACNRLLPRRPRARARGFYESPRPAVPYAECSMTSLPDTTTIESIERLLGRLRREVRIWIWVESLASIALAAVVIVAATLLLDWLLEPPGWARAAALVAAGAVLAWMLVTRLLLRLGTPLADRSLALAVERRQPELGDTLSTVVCLAAAPRGDVDPGLVKQTTQAAEALVDRVKPWRIYTVAPDASSLAANPASC